MILGLFISEKGGAPILTLSFSKYFDEQRAILTSQLLEAVKAFSEIGLGGTVRKIELENVYVYTLDGKNFSVSLFAEEDDEYLEDVIKEILNIVDSFQPMELRSNLSLRAQVIAKIRFHVFITAFGIKELKKIAESLYFLINMVDTKKTSIHVKEFKMKKLKIRKRALLRGRGKVTLSELLELYKKGDLEKIMSIPVSSLGVDYPDESLALFVAAGLTLARRPIFYKAPSIEDLISLSESIQDELLKKYLYYSILESMEVTASIEKRKIYLENKLKIYDVIKGNNKLKKQVYLIIFLNEPDMRIITEAIKTFKDSPFLYAFAKSIYYMIRLLSPPVDRLKWLNDVSRIYTEVQKSENDVNYSFIFLPYVFSIYSVLNINNIDLDDIKEMFNSIENFREIFLKMREKKLPLPTCHIAALDFLINVYYPFLKAIIFKDYNKFGDIENYLKNLIEGTIESNIHFRRKATIYCLILSLLLSLYALICYRNQTIIEQMPKYLIDLLEEPMDKLWTTNRFHYLLYVLGIVNAMIFTLMAMPYHELKNELLKRLINILKQIWAMSKRIPMISIFILYTLKEVVAAGYKDYEIGNILNEAKNVMPNIIADRIIGDNDASGN